jgi:hypothetical protein
MRFIDLKNIHRLFSGAAPIKEARLLSGNAGEVPLGIAKSGPSRNLSFLNAFYDFEATAQKKAQPGREAASPPACAVGAFIGLHGHTRF